MENKDRNILFIKHELIQYNSGFPGVSNIKRGVCAVIIIFFAFLTTGCVTLYDPESSQEYSAEYISHIKPGETFGQSFVSRRARLNGIDLWLHLDGVTQNKNAFVRVQIFHNLDDTRPIVTQKYSAETILHSNPLHIRFEPRTDPAGQLYYLQLDTSDGDLYIQGRNEDAYQSGNAWQNTSVINKDAALRLTYDYGWQALGNDISYSVSFLWLILPILVLFFLPGWLILSMSRYYARADITEKIPLAMGLSMAIIPVIMTWTSFGSLKWTPVSVRVIVIALVVLSIIIPTIKLITSDHPNRVFFWLAKKHAIYKLVTHKFLIGLIAIFLGSLAIRLIMIRDLATPAWIDSVHHALVTRMILEHGGFPKDYAPYLSLSTANYHAGYHSLVATFIWLTNLDIPQAMLILGQIFNACSVLVAYQLTTTLTNNRRSGIFAALLTGIFSPMPAYYTSWGRYTELAGLLLLPSAIELINATVNITGGVSYRLKNNQLSNALLASLVCGGLFITHYRVIIFLGCFLVAFILIHIPEALDNPIYRTNILGKSIWLTGIVLFSMVLTLPWIIPALSTLIVPMIGASGAAGTQISEFSWSLLTAASGKVLLFLAAGGLLINLFRYKRTSIAIVYWIVALFFVANLNVLRLPGGGLINNTSMLIALFLPISIFGGSFIDQVVRSAEFIAPTPQIRTIFRVIFLLFIIVVSAQASLRLIPILNPVTIQSRRADLPAMEWISTNIPIGETIFINPFPWGYGLYAGSDGGYWITPLTGRKTMPPPVLYALDGNTSSEKSIITITQDALKTKDDLSKLQRLLYNNGIKYIYLGAKGGVVSPIALEHYPGFVQEYSQNDVAIFRVLSP